MIIVYADKRTPRLLYTLDFIFKEVLGTEFTLVTDWNLFTKSDLPKINYSKTRWDKGISIIPHKLLFESGIRQQKIRLRKWRKKPVFFTTDKDVKIPFDLFAATFYLISRYEEYLDFKPDEHGRFPAKESLAYKYEFLESPIVNYWLKSFRKILLNEYPDFLLTPSHFRFTTTIDVDMAFCYKHKGVWRNLGGFTRELLRLDIKKIEKRYRVLTDQEEDPFDNFDYQADIHARFGTDSIYFILLADHGKFDKNIDFDNEAFLDLIQGLTQTGRVGIHPSYASNKNLKKLSREIQRLEDITLNKVDCSRQHFLKLDIKATYQRLIQEGIREDHSMGYSDVPGFRAGTCTPFFFYDLSLEKKTALKVYPFAVMDVALNRFMKLSVPEAKKKVSQLLRRVRQVKGHFISVFHNESLSDFDNWKGWREVYEHLLREASELEQSKPHKKSDEPGASPERASC